MPDFLPLQLLLITFAGWTNRRQAEVIDYLVEENRILKEQLRGKRLRLTDDQRRRLAAKGKALGRKLLDEIATIVTPDTIMRWHRRLIAAKWTYARPRTGRPGLMQEIRALIVRMATDNSSWGYCKIQGALQHVGHAVVRSTIAKTLKEHGIKPAPDRPTSWRTFIKSHADVIAAADFFTTEVWTARGLVTQYTLFVIDVATRAVHIAGTNTSPDGAFMAQVARNLTDGIDRFLNGKRFLIVDRDTKFTDEFRAIFRGAGVELVRTAFQASNMNAFAERWVRSIKHECLDRMISSEQPRSTGRSAITSPTTTPSARTRGSGTSLSKGLNRNASVKSSSAKVSVAFCATTTAQPDGSSHAESPGRRSSSAPPFRPNSADARASTSLVPRPEHWNHVQTRTAKFSDTTGSSPGSASA